MIRVQKVSKHYGAIKALEDVSFEIGHGEIVGLLGPNGAGKTTLLKILTGFFEPGAGRVEVGGVDVVAEPVEARRKIGYLPENAPLYPEMLVQESLLMSAELHGIELARRLPLVRKAVEATGLISVVTRPVGKLSKGFHQRVGLAQAILHEPDILILDEPTSGLDPDQIVEVRKLVRSLARRSTVIISTHILAEVEQSCERVLVLMNGRLRADARLDELKQTHRFHAVFAAGADMKAIRSSLDALDGVQAVELDVDEAGRACLLVQGQPDVDLGELVYEHARGEGWPLRELRPDTRSLESVFRALSSGREVQL
ncbi:MAG: ATP-binding cassette domain-containing protein [Deltaproteobacteria bacterium]|nr:ATP-binding cassette domain-containing protein [Deltaproteobacteria bacterium]